MYEMVSSHYGITGNPGEPHRLRSNPVLVKAVRDEQTEPRKHSVLGSRTWIGYTSKIVIL